MKEVAHGIGVILFLITWLSGAVVAVGLWKVLAILFPPYGWYLLVEIALQRAGIV
jgi:hypothetical protein